MALVALLSSLSSAAAQSRIAAVGSPSFGLSVVPAGLGAVSFVGLQPAGLGAPSLQAPALIASLPEVRAQAGPQARVAPAALALPMSGVAALAQTRAVGPAAAAAAPNQGAVGVFSRLFAAGASLSASAERGGKEDARTLESVFDSGGSAQGIGPEERRGLFREAKGILFDPGVSIHQQVRTIAYDPRIEGYYQVAIAWNAPYELIREMKDPGSPTVAEAAGLLAMVSPLLHWYDAAVARHPDWFQSRKTEELARSARVTALLERLADKTEPLIYELRLAEAAGAAAAKRLLLGLALGLAGSAALFHFAALAGIVAAGATIAASAVLARRVLGRLAETRERILAARRSLEAAQPEASNPISRAR